tara:strand:+ start:130 stop:309 length:180 start_codon:yes stop_codon:yes gene_type:complete
MDSGSILFMIALAVGGFALIYLVGSDHQEHGMSLKSVVKAAGIVIALAVIIALITQGGQ